MKLPEDILIDILLRLPLKSLSILKTVCKSLCCIIKSTQFVKLHLNRAHSTRYNQHKDVLGLLIPSSEGSNCCVLYNIQNPDSTILAKEIRLPFKLLEVCNYCDGLICFNIAERDILLWNPSLPKEYYKIIPMKTKPAFLVGIGYDSTTDDYKIVRVPKFMYKGSRYPFVEVFSQKNSSWKTRKISKNFTYQLQGKKSIYTRNRLHWIGSPYGSKVIESIVYFDMVEERLNRLNVPECLNVPCELVSIFNYKDTIAITDCKTLWVLVGYNEMKNSWNIFKLPEFKYSDAELHSSIRYYYDRCFTRDGKLLIQLEQGGLKTYDLEDGYIRNVEIRGDNLIYQKDFINWFDASPYVESLVSPRWFG
ncbi:F-box and associated interaction domains-containing protein [Euphorbia peplus]|nr:F-box and associated interaction domains-containing protein [Euphorbia peplus]